MKNAGKVIGQELHNLRNDVSSWIFFPPSSLTGCYRGLDPGPALHKGLGKGCLVGKKKTSFLILVNQPKMKRKTDPFWNQCGRVENQTFPLTCRDMVKLVGRRHQQPTAPTSSLVSEEGADGTPTHSSSNKAE